jgi:hypothetical protein
MICPAGLRRIENRPCPDAPYLPSAEEEWKPETAGGETAGGETAEAEDEDEDD